MLHRYLITGGAGFIGSNYVYRLLSRGENVTIFDNLSRPGSHINIEWLQDCFGKDAFQLIIGDIRDNSVIEQAVKEAEIIIHLAGQVAVTTSVLNPREDFEINALGTFNVLEAARSSDNNPIFVYASTNKVYGRMDDVRILEMDSRYRYQDFQEGISEQQNLDFHSPYGCSKGCGDQYVRDYFRLYGIPSVVLRQSCIYGPRQFGIEDQGWVAWFVIASVIGKQISIFGDGKQVRDTLHIDDLLDIYDLVISKIEISAGQVYNVGGGSKNTISIWKEFGPILEELIGRPLDINKYDWRPGDQKIYISNIRKVENDLGWRPKICFQEGIEHLFQWVEENRHLFIR